MCARVVTFDEVHLSKMHLCCAAEFFEINRPCVVMVYFFVIVKGMGEYLVYNGGGVKGISLIGALAALEDLGLREQVRGAAGSSAGAVVALGVVLGLSASALEHQFRSFVSAAAMGNRLSALRLIRKFGANDSTFLVKQVEALLQIGGVCETITLRDLHYQTGRILHVTGTRLEDRATVVFNHIDFPDMEVRIAVAISSCIPFLFSPIEFSGAHYVDGCIAQDYPIEIFPPDRQLGFFMKTFSDTDSDPTSDIGTYALSVFRAFGQNYLYRAAKIHSDRTIQINCTGLNIPLYHMTCDEKNIRILWLRGYFATVSWYLKEVEKKQDRSELCTTVNDLTILKRLPSSMKAAYVFENNVARKL